MSNKLVTQKQYQLRDNETLVSYTDLAGNIIKANEAFVEASGYAWAELVGQPHNILRHPDVPKAVFKDLWETIQDERPWEQIVKNRRKNGDHYWVRAKTTCMYDNNRNVTGYMSVRLPATAEDIKTAETAYAAIEAGKLHLKNGNIYTLANKLNWFANINPLWSIILSTVIAMVALIAMVMGVQIDHSILLISIAVLTSFAALHAIYFVKKIRTALGHINQLAASNFNSHIETLGENMAGTLARKLFSMQIRLGDDFNTNAEMLLRSHRLEQALGALQANVIVIDQNNTIIYLNPSAQQLFKQIEPNIQQTVAHFNASKLVGQNIGDLCYQSDHPIKEPNKITEPLLANVDIAGHPLQLMFSPILNEDGRRIGTSIELRDVYMEQHIQEELKKTIHNASQGYIDTRVKTDDLSGFYFDLANQFNHLLESTETTLTQIGSTMHHVAEQNLTARIHHQMNGSVKDINDNINASLDNLSNTLQSIIDNIHQINQGIGQLNQANLDAAERTQQTATALQEINATVHEVSDATQAANQNATEATQYAHSVKSSAAKGVSTVNESVAAMHEVENHSLKIEEITSLIDSIAFQTNLLALNAAVEAARAGEHGRGFAVVAGEVRALAGKSSEAAKDIRTLIEETVAKIRIGSKTVQSTAVALKEIESHVDQVEQVINELSHTSNEQAQAMNNINHAVSRVDQMTQDAAEQAKFLVDMSKQMTHETETVMHELSKFNF